jgi:hypothetical protein
VRSNQDDQPHTLVIEHADHEKGEWDWFVLHLPTCPTEDVVGFGDEPLEYFTCRVQAVIDANGIDDIENWRELKPGKYPIKSYYEYYPGEYGGTYGEEHDIGIFLVEGGDIQ